MTERESGVNLNKELDLKERISGQAENLAELCAGARLNGRREIEMAENQARTIIEELERLIKLRRESGIVE